MPSVHRHIANEIDQQSSSSLIFPCDFRGLDSEDAINVNLSRHVANGRLNRLGHGVHINTKKKGNPPIPSLHVIALTISKKEPIKIKPAGAFSVQKLGLTDQQPENIIHMTNGEPRNTLISKKKLVFKSTTQETLSFSTGISELLAHAPEELGKNAITETLKSQTIKQLAQENEDVFMVDLHPAPAWICDLPFKLHQQLMR